jgi:two-component system, NtrC family, response regulator HydG
MEYVEWEGLNGRLSGDTNGRCHAPATAGGNRLSRLREALERRIRRWVHGPHAAAGERLTRFATALARAPYEDTLGQQLAETVADALEARGVALYLEERGTTTLKRVGLAGTLDLPAAVEPRTFASRNAGDAAGSEATEFGAPCCDPRFAKFTCVPAMAANGCIALLAVDLVASGGKQDPLGLRLAGLLVRHLALMAAEAARDRELAEPRAEIEALHGRLCAEVVEVHEAVRSAPAFRDIIGGSAALQSALAVVDSVARTDTSVLITGETGTGKELIARALHAQSLRHAGPLVSVNCPAIPRHLAESELFGHERGAFTDAVEARPGKFELADGGTIFLDEVADLPLEVQVKLLRVLQEREVQRIGSRRTRKLTLRVLAATNRDLLAEIRAQRFREDLYYRLATMVIHVPPLRDRCEDIPMLATHFLERAAAACGKQIDGFSGEALRILCRYPWPGNIRQLHNVVERAVLMCSGTVIAATHLADLAVNAASLPNHFTASIRDEKRRRIRAALEQAGGKQAAAARLLGISRSNLGRMMRTLGVSAPEARRSATLASALPD